MGIESDEWFSKAACAKADPEIFFPPRDKKLYRKIALEAKSYCFGTNTANPACPVQQECLWYAVNSDEMHGIWGGYSHRERNAIVRKWQRQYKSKMTLKEYIFEQERGKNDSTKVRT